MPAHSPPPLPEELESLSSSVSSELLDGEIELDEISLLELLSSLNGQWWVSESSAL
jgi:hypothetical protein